MGVPCRGPPAPPTLSPGTGAGGRPPPLQRTVSPLPAPQDIQAGAQQTLTLTLTPILSAVVTTGSQTEAPPRPPLPPVSVQSGNRAVLQIPEGKLADGASYRWSVRACTGVGCSPWSAQQSLTVRVQPLPPMPVQTETRGPIT